MKFRARPSRCLARPRCEPAPSCDGGVDGVPDSSRACSGHVRRFASRRLRVGASVTNGVGSPRLRSGRTALETAAAPTGPTSRHGDWRSEAGAAGRRRPHRGGSRRFGHVATSSTSGSATFRQSDRHLDVQAPADLPVPHDVTLPARRHRRTIRRRPQRSPCRAGRNSCARFDHDQTSLPRRHATSDSGRLRLDRHLDRARDGSCRPRSEESDITQFLARRAVDMLACRTDEEFSMKFTPVDREKPLDTIAARERRRTTKAA